MSFKAWLLPVALFCASTVVSAQNAADDLRRADKQFDLSAYNLALQSYQSVVQREPSNAYALARVGDCLVQLNRPDDALPWFDRATSQNDVKPEVLLNYGKTLMSVGNYTSAKRWFLFYAENNGPVGRRFAEMCDYAMLNAGKESNYNARNEAMNSPADEYAAAFFGKRVVFNSARTDLARSKKGADASNWSGNAYNQLLVTQADAAGNLQKPAFLKSDLANSYNEGPASFSADGKRVAFCKNNFADGARQVAANTINLSLYLADVVDGDWVNVKAFPFNGSEYGTGFPWLSADGTTLLFASNRPEGEGGWDIYSTVWTGKYWTTPVNLGKEVNTPGNEITPSMDGKNLFFASDWHMGFGGFDVFRAENVEGTWSKVFHLGPGINSSRDDYGFVFNGSQNIGYLNSNRPGGKGNQDIWQIRKKTDDFVITITDAAKKPIAEAGIDFSACGGAEYFADTDGKYAFSVAAGQANCKATVRKKGYRNAIAEIKSSGAKAIAVVLESDMIATFTGTVFDQNQKGVEEASIRALPMPKGDLVAATTGKNGAYSLVLEIGKTYKIQYSKDGYSDTIFTLQTDNAKATNELPPVVIAQSSSLVSSIKKAAEAEIAPATYGFVETKKTETKTAKDAGQQESVILKSLKDQPAAQAKGWAIQVASVPGSLEEGKLEKYDNLRTLGNVYTSPGVKTTKIRLGVYENRSDAEAVLKKVAALKYKSPFVVEEKSVDSKLIVAIKPAEKPAKKDDAPALAYQFEGDKAAAPAGKVPVRFAVQVASLKNDESVNLAPYMKISDVGNVYTRPENDMTKIRVGIWESHEEAEAAQEAIVKKGFKDAVVVTEKAVAATERFLIKKEAAPAKAAPTKKTTSKGSDSKQIVRPIQHSLEAPKPAPSPYKVRVATYEDADNFDATTLAGVKGKLEKKKQGKLTIFLLGGYPGLEEALQAKNAVRELGYKDAHVVKDVNGKLSKMKL